MTATNTVAKSRRMYVSTNLEVDTAVNTKSQGKENPEATIKWISWLKPQQK